LKKGYERATARDIAAAAGVSLAAIGYHFRSREALLTEALLVAIGEWDRDFRQTLEAGVPRAASPRKRFEAVWAQLIRTFETHRALWIANFELFSQMDRWPEIRRYPSGPASLRPLRAGVALPEPGGGLDLHARSEHHRRIPSRAPHRHDRPVAD
jgi:AcrR family transcriptional regulator